MSDKTVIVTEHNGGERHYRADDWDADGEHRLAVSRQASAGETSVTEHRIVAEYAPGAWLSVRESGAEVPDATVRALGIARAALGRILDASGNADEPFGRPEVTAIARDGLSGSYDEEDPF